MKTKEMIVYKESFIYKIKKFLKNLFGKQEEYIPTYEQTNDSEEEIKNKKEFLEDVKVSVNNNITQKAEFLKHLDGNREALNLLSIEKLEKLERYYKGVIEENEKKIKKLKANA